MFYAKSYQFYSLAMASFVLFSGIARLPATPTVNSPIALADSAQLQRQIADRKPPLETSIPPSKISEIADVKQIDKESLLETALKVPATTLLEGYEVVITLLSWLPAAENGMTIQTPSQTIGPDNAADVRVELEQKRDIYESAIQQRGYQLIAGEYRATATSACEKIQSAWADAIAKEMIETFTIEQDEFTLNLVHLFKDEDQKVVAELPATIVESSFIFTDPMNSDFRFIGEVITPEEIIIRPNVEEVLAAWPTAFGFKPPSRENLESCKATLRSVNPLQND